MLAGGIAGRFAKIGKIKHVAKLAESSAIRLGTLKKIGENTWESAAGLLYEGLDKKGLNRIEHVLLHAELNPAKKVHTMFNVERNKVLELVDEAWLRRGSVLPDDPNVYIVPMERVIGSAGEEAIRLVIEVGTNKVVTAYPIKL